MSAIPRVSPTEMLEKLSGKGAFLVCAYEEDEAFFQMHLPGAISMRQFLDRLPMLPWESEIIFYCASAGSAYAVGLAGRLKASGFQRVGVLEGGISAWKDAGLPLVPHHGFC